ncbi:F-box/kelch-repeat protein [Capsicum baccatum]|uniref:F-box/kelch-repeat protein n=1 Tax=Capsicum baccatum TaxID=33114 RepID=A0A2G2VAR0_CAPBA|nr:F-box/kelch-repeat protein [Capsicum baccatum]
MWRTLRSMNKSCKMCSGVFMDGKFYVIGGIGGAVSKLLTCAEEYDLATGRWTEIPNMSPVRPNLRNDIPATSEAPPLLVVVNNQLFILYSPLYLFWFLIRHAVPTLWDYIGSVVDFLCTLYSVSALELDSSGFVSGCSTLGVKRSLSKTTFSSQIQNI